MQRCSCHAAASKSIVIIVCHLNEYKIDSGMTASLCSVHGIIKLSEKFCNKHLTGKYKEGSKKRLFLNRNDRKEEMSNSVVLWVFFDKFKFNVEMCLPKISDNSQCHQQNLASLED